MSATDFSSSFQKYIVPNYGYIRLPEITISKEQKALIGLEENVTNREVLLALARDGFKKKQNKIKKERWKEYGDRVKYEISILDELGFVDYILLVWQVMNKAKEMNIFLDYGRGSVAGSAVCWFLGISGVDPIEKHLFFERFVSKVRAGKKIIDGSTYLKGDLLADVDINLGDGRDKIVEWLKLVYPNRVSKIINFSTLTTRILLKDVSKIYKEYSEDEAKAISDLIESKFGVVQEIEDAYKSSAKFKEWADKNTDIVEVSQKLSGLLRQTSIHASGYLVSYFELSDIVPLERSKEGELVSSYDMRKVSNFATKLDLLGLTTNRIIKDILDNIDEKVEDIELDTNPIIYDQYQAGELLPYGLYQISADCAYRVLNKVKPKNIGELSDVNAIARPGALAYVDNYVKGDAKILNPLFEPILKDTRNLCLYQETLMQLAVAIGFTLDDAEVIRKVVGKKQLEKVKEWEAKIYKKVEESGLSKEIADAYWKLVNDSASYSFNKSHSVATAYLSALTTYLKYQHPLQFYIACLRGTRELADPIGEINQITKELKYFNIKLLPPDIIKSDLDFKVEDNNIRFGLSHIKGISGATVDKLLQFRREFVTKFQIFEVANECKIPINILAGLIYCGCLDGRAPSRARLVLEAQTYNILTPKEKPLIHNLAKEFNEDLLLIVKELTTRLNEKGKPYIKESRFETIKKKYEPFKQVYLENSRNEELCSFIMERLFLGFSYSSSLFDIYSKRYEDLNPIKQCCSELKETNCKFAGFIDEIKKGKTKAKSTPYLKLTISDESGSCQVMIFGEQKIKNIETFHNKELEEDQIVIIEGKNMGENTFFADCILIQENPIALKRKDLNKDI